MNTRKLNRCGERVFDIRLDTCWPQFARLKERLEGYLQRVAQKLALPGVEIVNLWLSVEMSVKHGR